MREGDKASGGLLHSVRTELDRAEEAGVTQEGHRQVLGTGTEGLVGRGSWKRSL